MSTFVNTDSFRSVSNVTVWTETFTLTTASGNDRLIAIIVSGSASSVETIDSVTFDGTTGTIVGQDDADGGRAGYVAVAYFDESDLPATAGDYDIVVTFSGASGYADLVVEEWEDVADQTTPIKNLTFTPATAVTSGSTQSKTLSSASGDIGYTFALLTGNNTTNTTSAPANTDVYTYSPASGRAVLNVARDNAVASAAEQYDWTVNQGTDPIQSQVLGTFSIDAASTAGPTITNATPNNADTLTALTTSPAYTSPVSGVTYNGTSLASVVEATATTITTTMPRGGQAFGSSNDFQVTDADGASNLFAATFNAPTGWTYVDVTGIDAEGVFPPGTAIGDQLAYELLTSGAHSVSVSGTGIVTYGAGAVEGETFTAYLLDSSDSYSAGSDFVVTISSDGVSLLVLETIYRKLLAG